jgi:transglutaminase-like putative cysteine protease
MTNRFLARLGSSSLAGVMAWVALWSWQGLVESPEHFIRPAFLGCVLVVLTGTGARALRWPWYAVVPVQVVVLLGWLNHYLAGGASLRGWIPTSASVTSTVHQIHDGAVAVNTFASPVSAEHPETYAYLLAAGLLVLVSTDLLACGLRRVPSAGLPVIITLTVPISVLETGLSGFVFVVTALLFIMLLATEETERVLGWGRSIAGHGRRVDSLDQVVNGSTVRGTAFRIGLLTATGALVIPLLIPVTHGLLKGGRGPGGGSGDGGSVALSNPIVDLRRDLIEKNHIPLVYAQTDADPSYLRLTVLDRFNSVEWLPSTRQLPSSNRAAGPLPAAPGLSPTLPGTEARWSIRLDDSFHTRWLATPYPTREIDIERGDWRYDLRTLDIAQVDNGTSMGLRYNLTGFSPDYSSARLDDAFAVPANVFGPMTSLPGDLPSVIGQTAREVTRGAQTDYARAAMLQSWFRNSGGFSYSLEPASGSGMKQLARFITDDKVGYCEQFAAAMAVMARTLDIPSRVVVGFLSPEQLDDGSYLYTSDDLHAWPELYFSGSGWVRFEPTPSTRTGDAPSWTTGLIQSTASALPSPSATQSNRPVAPADNGATSQSSTSGTGAAAKAAAWGVGIVLLLLLLALPRMLRSGIRRRRLATDPDPRVTADGAWAELCATARDLRIALPLDRTVRDIRRALTDRVRPGPDDLRTLDELVEFVERARYGRSFVVDDATRERAVQTVDDWSALLVDSVPRGRARSAWLFPRSVLDRSTPITSIEERQSELVGAPEVR